MSIAPKEKAAAEGAKSVSSGRAELCHLQSSPGDSRAAEFQCQGRAAPAEQNLCSGLRRGGSCQEMLRALRVCLNRHISGQTPARRRGGMLGGMGFFLAFSKYS